MRYLYNLLIYLAAPLAFLMELWRGVRDPSYRERRGERLGFGPPLSGESIRRGGASVEIPDFTGGVWQQAGE